MKPAKIVTMESHIQSLEELLADLTEHDAYMSDRVHLATIIVDLKDIHHYVERVISGDAVIEIRYNGAYPNLCRGNLEVIIDGESWIFEDYCLFSNGGITDDYDTYEGDWEVKDDYWPAGFPEILKPAVTKAINEGIPHGCCGGCI